MEFIKEESEDVKIEEAFSIKDEDTEEQTDLVMLKMETDVKNEVDEEKKDNDEHHDFIINGKSFSCPPTEKEKGKTTRSIRKLGCQKCGKIFNSDSNLNAHMKIHAGEKYFTCQQCGKSFIYKGALNFHMKTHTEKKPSTCPLCGKIFRRLKYHMIIHTTEKLFTCPQCGKSFKRQGMLTRHMKIHNTKSHSHVRQIMPKNHLGITGVNLFAINLDWVSQTGDSTSAQNE